MKAIEFPEVNLRIAENQPQYETLPALVTGERGEVTICFELDEDERKQVAETGRVWLSFLTFRKPFQPIWGSCLKPESCTEPELLTESKPSVKGGGGYLVEHRSGKRGRTFNSEIEINGKIPVYFETDSKFVYSREATLCNPDNLTKIGFID